RHHVSHHAFAHAGRVEQVVTVEVLGIEHAVAVAASRTEVTPREHQHPGRQQPLAERQLLHQLAVHEDSVGTVTQNADIVGRGVENAVSATFGVQLALAHQLPAGEHRVASGGNQFGGRDTDRILVDGAEINHHLQPGRV